MIVQTLTLSSSCIVSNDCHEGHLTNIDEQKGIFCGWQKTTIEFLVCTKPLATYLTITRRFGHNGRPCFPLRESEMEITRKGEYWRNVDTNYEEIREYGELSR